MAAALAALPDWRLRFEPAELAQQDTAEQAIIAQAGSQLARL